MHVTKSLGPYDMIICRKILKFLKIDLRFSDEIIKWDGAEMPFKDGDASTKEAHYVADSDPVEDTVPQVKRILDAKCDKADIEKICEEQAELDRQQQEQLAVLLCKYVHDWTARARAQIGRMRQENQLAPPAASDATNDEHNLAQIASLKSAVRNVQRIQQQLPADDGDKKIPAKAAIILTRSNQRPYNATTETTRDTKRPAKKAKSNITETDTTATSRILPSLDDLFLPEEEKVFIEDHIIPWLNDNDYTLDEDGTFYTDSIIPPAIQEWFIGRGAQLAAIPPTRAIPEANVAANPPLAEIEVDAQGDTLEDPIVIDKSTSNSDNESAEGTDKTT